MKLSTPILTGSKMITSKSLYSEFKNVNDIYLEYVEKIWLGCYYLRWTHRDLLGKLFDETHLQ